jgi:hypothetical protein
VLDVHDVVASLAESDHSAARQSARSRSVASRSDFAPIAKDVVETVVLLEDHDYVADRVSAGRAGGALRPSQARAAQDRDQKHEVYERPA